jgi:hypothetical protein
VRGDPGRCPSRGRRGCNHVYYQNLIARSLRRKEWTPEIEHALKTKRVDVGAVCGPILHAYEVVNEGLEKKLLNLNLDLVDGRGRVIFWLAIRKYRSSSPELISDIGDQVLEVVEFRLLTVCR